MRMKRYETISSWQMSTLFLAFLTGSSIINIPAPLTTAARNAAWLSLLLASGFGFLLLACILYLYRKYPRMTLFEYSRQALGKWLTLLLAVPFILLVLTDLSYIVTDIAGFFTSVMMPFTPGYIFNSLILLIAALTVRAGIEVMARMFLLLMYITIIFGMVVIIFAIPYYNPVFLLPIFPEGIKPLLHGAYIASGFPYAEMVYFTFLLPFVSKDQEGLVSKHMYFALLLNAILLSAAIVFTIMALGPLSGELKFSLYQIARLISVAEVIERIESIIGISLVVGSYMKTTIALYTLNYALSKLLNLTDDRLLIYPLAFIALLLTLVMFKNETEFVEQVTVVWPLFTALAGAAPVVLVASVTFIKERISKT
jgi:spore germination protein KB